MKFKPVLTLIFISFLLSGMIISCSSSSDDVAVIEAPSNLVFEANIVGRDTSNPYGDGSGTVIFNFLANNANLFKIDLGNGDVAESTGNSITYTYIGSGESTFTINISAYNGDKFISSNITITVQIGNDSGLNLIWSDEFNYTGSPESTKWNYNIGRGDNGWGNGEAQYYTSRLENVKVEDGYLTITAKKENYEGAEYTSTRLLTQGKFDFTYGKVEVRAKLPIGAGTWPAIWMLGDSFSTVGWPASGEIDIMEQTGADKNNTLGTCHWFDSGTNANASYGETTAVTNASSEFHIYSLEWTEDSLKIFVDDVKFYELANNGDLPFNDNFFMILNVAMGGSLGGTIDAGFTEDSMEVDYVRVYQ